MFRGVRCVPRRSSRSGESLGSASEYCGNIVDGELLYGEAQCHGMAVSIPLSSSYSGCLIVGCR